MTIEELIAALEAATGDAPLLFRMALDLAHMEGWITDLQWSTANLQIIHGAYIDAALTLVPEGWVRRNRQIRFGMWLIELWQGDKSFAEKPDAEGIQQTEALAICIAALKSRAAT